MKLETKTVDLELRAAEPRFAEREFADVVCRWGMCHCADEPGVHTAPGHRGPLATHEATCRHCGKRVFRRHSTRASGAPWRDGAYDETGRCPIEVEERAGTPVHHEPAVPAPMPKLPAGVVPIVVDARVAGEGRRFRAVLVRYARRTLGGWDVRRADNGRQLGWLCHDTDARHGRAKTWNVHVDPQAFCGSDVDDTGDRLDEVPGHLTREWAPGRHAEVSTGEATREDAAGTLVRWLAEHRAPAVGYGRRHDVIEWYAEPHRHIRDSDGGCMCGRSWPCPRLAELTGARS